MQTAHCTLYSLHCTLLVARCTLYPAKRTLHNVRCKIQIVTKNYYLVLSVCLLCKEDENLTLWQICDIGSNRLLNGDFMSITD